MGSNFWVFYTGSYICISEFKKNGMGYEMGLTNFAFMICQYLLTFFWKYQKQVSKNSNIVRKLAPIYNPRLPPISPKTEYDIIDYIIEHLN